MATQVNRDLEFPHVARMDWIDVEHSDESWNQLCARGLEVFGLPGDRYMTHVCSNYMTWHFRDPHDLTLFLLAWPARYLEEQTI